MDEIGEIQNKGISRRGFLKAGGAFVASLFLKAVLPETSEASQENKSVSLRENFLLPELLHGVKVYGLNEKITSRDQIDKLYKDFDDIFEGNLSPELKGASRFEQRESVLPENKRYVEFMVRQSAYDEWQKNNDLDYVSWAKLHVDLLNRICRNAKPPSELSTELLRVVVVSDNFSDSQTEYSKDMDASWFNEIPKVTSSYYWNYMTQSYGSVAFFLQNEGIDGASTVHFPPAEDSFRTFPKGKVDYGTLHELFHQILNLPDEYNFDCDFRQETINKFKRFFLTTAGSMGSWFSPNLALILRYNQAKKIRGYYTDQGGLGTDSAYQEANVEKPLPDTLKPNICEFELKEKDKTLEDKTEIFEIRQEGDYAGKKSLPDSPDQVSESGRFIFDPELLKPRKLKDKFFSPMNWVIKNGDREIYMPSAALSMSKIVGKDKATYQIEFSGIRDDSKTTQTLVQIDESDLVQFLSNCEKRGERYYAKMRVDGTSAYFLWFLK